VPTTECFNWKMDVDTSASTWMTLPTVTLTFDLQNLIRLSVVASGYSL